MLNSVRTIQSCFLAAFFLFSTTQSVFSYTSSEVFHHHLKRVFVETGSYQGDGIQNALDAGFEEIYSIELSPRWFNYCTDRFQNNPHVHLYLGDSSTVLRMVLEEIDEPATFWLDGHCSLGNPLTAKGDRNSPILEELDLIGNHGIKTHTLLIDDVRLFGSDEFDYVDKNEIIEAVKKINPDYRIYYEDGYVRNDVLVAEIGEE
jgi:hypothetical protein